MALNTAAAASVAVVKVALHSIITQKSGTARFLPEQ